LEVHLKKITRSLLSVFVLFIFLTVSALPAAAQETAEKVDKKDPMKDFSIVEQVQPVPAELKTGFDSITGKDAATFLQFISSDLLEGRETGGQGYDIAAEYAVSLFSLWGLQPAGDFDVKTPDPHDFFSSQSHKEEKKPKRTYFQEIALKERVKHDSLVTVEMAKGTEQKTRTFYPDMDYTFSSGYSQGFSAPVVFVGYGISEKGIKYDDYAGIDVKGKIVMMLSEGPGWNDPESPFNKNNLKEKYTPNRMMRRMGGSPKVKLADDKGAIAVLMVENSIDRNPDIAEKQLISQKINDERPIFPGERKRMRLIRETMKLPWGSLPTVNISREMANIILESSGKEIETLKSGIEKGNKPNSFSLPGVTFKIDSTVEEKLIRGRNVLAYLEGSDPKLKDEVVIVGAHLDHLGRRGDYIFNGADDNGSGSVGVMALARAFALNPVKPKRSILFALWTGEEEGLLGSRYYASNPFFSLKNTVAYINHDMISRVWAKNRLVMMARRFGADIPKEFSEKIKPENFLSISLCESDKLYNMLKENNKYIGMQIHLRPTSSFMGGSDHAPFAYLKVPWIGFMAAMTEDYHQPSDTVDKISPEMMEKIIRISWLTAFSIADAQ
jgi:hypothetical protein